MNLGLRGKRVVVTGASRGIGRATCEQFALEGAELALVARSGEAIRGLAESLRAQERVAVPIEADLATPDGPARAIAEAGDRLGSIDILINNAGTSAFGSFDVVDDDAWTGAFDLKLMGYVRCIRAVLPLMRKQHAGTIINVVGVGGRHATPGYALGAFNAALLHLTKSVAELVAADGIRVAAINPGFTTTERMLDAMRLWARESRVDVETYTRNYLGNLPLGRFSEPDEIARMIVLLASPLMHMTAGSALQADGGAARGHF